MNISVSTYSFNRLLAGKEMTQFDCIAKTMEMGFDAIEFSDILPPEGKSKEEYARVLGAECRKVGLPVSSLTFAADFLNGSQGNTGDEVNRVKKMIDIADILGAKLVRHDAIWTSDQPFDKTLPIAANACREVTGYAQSKGIRTTVENHGYFYQDSDRMEKLYTAVDHPNFGLLLDMGNFLCVDENPAEAIGKLARFAFHAHAKDFHIKSAMHPDPGEGFIKTRSENYLRGSIIGHGNVPVLQCIKALKRVNYAGCLAIEFEGMEDPLQAISISLKNLRRYIAEANN
jgi:sugar phosphate isomerase/epimerase